MPPPRVSQRPSGLQSRLSGFVAGSERKSAGGPCQSASTAKRRAGSLSAALEAGDGVGEGAVRGVGELEPAEGQQLRRLALAGLVRRLDATASRTRRGLRAGWRSRPQRRSAAAGGGGWRARSWPQRTPPRARSARPGSAHARPRTPGTPSRSTAGRRTGRGRARSWPPGGAGRAAALPRRPGPASAGGAASWRAATRG